MKTLLIVCSAVIFGLIASVCCLESHPKSLRPSSLQEITVHGFHILRGTVPTDMEKKMAESSARICASYATQGFDFTIALSNGSRIDKMTTESRLVSCRQIGFETMKLKEHALLVHSIQVPETINTSAKIQEEKKGRVTKKFTILLVEKELRLGVVQNVLRKALALHFLDRLKEQKEYEIQGHAWLNAISGIEKVDDDTPNLLKVEVELLLPKR